MLRELSLPIRQLFAALLAAAGLAYLVIVAATYLKTTPPSSLSPDLNELHRLLFIAARPICAMERRLAASDTPLGTGPLISAGASMSAVFSGGSNELANHLSETELARRDGERRALLDWIRSGASQTAYERDDYQLTNRAEVTFFTPQFIVHEASATDATDPLRVRIRSIVNERCVNCHHEEGDDTARLIPFHDYPSIALYLRPETHADTARPWLLAALLSLFPLAALTATTFAFTSYPLLLRRIILADTAAALTAVAASWLAGPSLALVLFTAAVAAMILVMVQLLATATELFGFQSTPFRVSPCRFDRQRLKLET